MKRFLWLAVIGLAAAAPLHAREPKLLGTLDGHTDAVAAVAFSPDGKTLASGSVDETIKLWDVATGKNITTVKTAFKDYLFGVYTCGAFSPDGNTLAIGIFEDQKTIKLLDLRTVKTADK